MHRGKNVAGWKDTQSFECSHPSHLPGSAQQSPEMAVRKDYQPEAGLQPRTEGGWKSPKEHSREFDGSNSDLEAIY